MKSDSISYSIGRPGGRSKEFSCPSLAAKAFYKEKAAKRPFIIRISLYNGRETAAIVGSTSVMTNNGVKTYGKWLGSIDKDLSQAYSTLTQHQTKPLTSL
jgi:hypothetical protein